MKYVYSADEFCSVYLVRDTESNEKSWGTRIGIMSDTEEIHGVDRLNNQINVFSPYHHNEALKTATVTGIGICLDENRVIHMLKPCRGSKYDYYHPFVVSKFGVALEDYSLMEHYGKVKFAMKFDDSLEFVGSELFCNVRDYDITVDLREVTRDDILTNVYRSVCMQKFISRVQKWDAILDREDRKLLYYTEAMLRTPDSLLEISEEADEFFIRRNKDLIKACYPDNMSDSVDDMFFNYEENGGRDKELKDMYLANGMT